MERERGARETMEWNLQNQRIIQAQQNEYNRVRQEEWQQ
jgi:hypothetical protein